MLDTDENVVEYLEEHFKDVRVSCEPRPDGALLVTLRNNQGKRLMSRAISGQEQSSPLLLNQVLERIRRDLIIDQGPLQTRDSDYFRKRIDLLTFRDSDNQHRPAHVPRQRQPASHSSQGPGRRRQAAYHEPGSLSRLFQLRVGQTPTRPSDAWSEPNPSSPPPSRSHPYDGGGHAFSHFCIIGRDSDHSTQPLEGSGRISGS
ncbi:DUF3509 domain-containing protein [Pseudomonas aeruginosa]